MPIALDAQAAADRTVKGQRQPANEHQANQEEADAEPRRQAQAAERQDGIPGHSMFKPAELPLALQVRVEEDDPPLDLAPLGSVLCLQVAGTALTAGIDLTVRALVLKPA